MDQESPETRHNGDSDKEVLAPSEGPRENLIGTAVKFLQNPKVMTSPLYQKKAFLEKKGLTQEEINIAIERSGVKESTSTEVVPSQGGPPPGYQPGALAVNPQIPPQYYAPIPPRSAWARARDLTMTTVVVASVSYAVYQLFQKYLHPLVFGKSAHEKRLDRLEDQLGEIQKAVSESLTEMTKTLASIQMNLNKQQAESFVGQSEVKGISDLKADIASLKGLLLNRNQFPPAPATSPVLPSWQRAQPSLAAAPSPPAQMSSYADALKHSPTAKQNQDSSDSQTETLESSSATNSLEPVLVKDSIANSEIQANGIEDGNQDHQDLSYGENANADTVYGNAS